MARIKKDQRTWNGQILWNKAFVIPPEEDRRKSIRRKNYKKYCKGIVGRKHKYERVTKWVIGSFTRKIDKCQLCGKEKGYF